MRRIDQNGSIVLFIRLLKRFADPVMKNPEREEFDRIFSIGLKAKLRTIFDARGFKDVTIDVVDGVVYLSGSVPQGKNAEAIELVKSFYGRVKVESRLTEK